MKELLQRKPRVLRVIRCTRPNGQQVSFIANDKRVLCLQRGQGIPWEPVVSENIGLARAVNRL